MRKVLFIVAFLTISNTSLACLNETRTNARGQAVEADQLHYHFPQYRINPSDKDRLDKLKDLDSLWRTNHIIDDYSDYGVTLVYLGRFEDARDVFMEIEKIQPGRYATAANLGTVYELLGEDAIALRWIKKAVEIDPSSHDHSEWIHVKILEAKIGGEHLITSDFLLNTSFGDGDIPATKLSNEQLAELGQALRYQMYERLSLVRPRDKIVALLLFELGNIISITHDVDLAIEIYDKAKAYGFQSDLLEKRRKKFEVLRGGVVEQEAEATDIPYRPLKLVGPEDDGVNGYSDWGIWLASVLAVVVLFGAGWYVLPGKISAIKKLMK